MKRYEKDFSSLRIYYINIINNMYTSMSTIYNHFRNLYPKTNTSQQMNFDSFQLISKLPNDPHLFQRFIKHLIYRNLENILINK